MEFIFKNYDFIMFIIVLNKMELLSVLYICVYFES